MKKEQFLTNERLRKKFYSFFDLSNYAIQIAKEKIMREEKVTLSDIIEELINLPDDMIEKQA